MDLRTCPACGSKVETEGHYCSSCGYCLALLERAKALREEAPLSSVAQPISKMGRYPLLRRIGKGGMGEVFLAWDPIALRHVALKRIQPQLVGKDVIYRRFLREARITSRLSHPGVIAIYSLHAENGDLYYTMPFVKGRTLKEILREARRQENRPATAVESQTSIPALIRVFVSLCQVIAYAHSRGVLHRDLKPENVMLGDFGEVYVLDWGLAKALSEEETPPTEEDADEEGSSDLTLPGRIFGTLSYLAPERAIGHPATVLSDVYALGVILYQILCLRLPFKRESVKGLRKRIREEVLIDPAKRAPYRNVPEILSRIAERALDPSLPHRYQSVSEMLRDLENYLEGRSNWFQIAMLDPEKKEDWEFQESVYLARDTALTGSAEITEWVNLMISKRSFPGNLRIRAEIQLKPSGAGIGFLLSVPEPGAREFPDIGYCLWISGSARNGSRLIHSSVEVLDAPDVFLTPGKAYEIRIERIENSLYFYLNDELKFSYISHLPIGGTHVGLMMRDTDFELSKVVVDVGSYSVKVNCLAVPDAFLANRDYERALAEYRRIGYSFPERDEGREAKFRAGVTLLEQAKSGGARLDGFDAALEEFEALAGTPLEYLGKSLVYAAEGDNVEEVKCFQLAFRRYRNHPLLPLLKEQVLYRMHEASRKDRASAYRFVLLCAQLLPDTWEVRATKRLIDRLGRHWEPLLFMLPLPSDEKRDPLHRYSIAIQLAFWLAQPYALLELAEEIAKKHPGSVTLSNALFGLIELGSHQLAKPLIEQAPKGSPPASLLPLIALHEGSIKAAATLLASLPHPPARVIVALMEAALQQDDPAQVFEVASLAVEKELTPQQKVSLESLQIWADLVMRNWESARKRFDHFPLAWINLGTSMLHPLYGCFLAAMEGEAIARIHLAGILETPFPRSHALLGHYLTALKKQFNSWLDRAFLWEKRQLYRQLELYYRCLNDGEQAGLFAAHARAQYTSGAL